MKENSLKPRQSVGICSPVFKTSKRDGKGKKGNSMMQHKPSYRKEIIY